MDKKGDMYNLTKEWITWIIQAIVFFVVISMLFIIIYIPISQEFKIDGLRHSLLRQHLIYDKNCLAYEDDRVYPGIIDINKFTQSNVENCFSIEQNRVQINLRTDTIKTVELNDQWGNFAFCIDKKNFYCSNTTYYVLVKENDITKQGVLDIAIISPK